MEQYIQISKLNDYIFCPRSIYFHSVYEDFDKKLYHRIPQTVGSIKHENIDNGEYSTAKKYLQGIEVFCEKYNIAGKIDVFNTETGKLIERKYEVKEIYDGYRYQLYAQYFCLQEMGYQVKSLLIHSLKDNKRYKIDLPNKEATKQFEELLKNINEYNLDNNININTHKCKQCIYSELCQ